MAVIEYLERFGRKIAKLLSITDMFQNEETYGAFGMSIFIAIFFVFFGWIIHTQIGSDQANAFNILII